MISIDLVTELFHANAGSKGRRHSPSLSGAASLAELTAEVVIQDK
jgi:hypothetical protein